MEECFSACTRSRRTALKGRKKDEIGAVGMEERVLMAEVMDADDRDRATLKMSPGLTWSCQAKEAEAPLRRRVP